LEGLWESLWEECGHVVRGRIELIVWILSSGKKEWRGEGGREEGREGGKDTHCHLLRDVGSGSIHSQVLDDVVGYGDREEGRCKLEEKGTERHGDVERGPGGDELVGVCVAGFFLGPPRDATWREGGGKGERRGKMVLKVVHHLPVYRSLPSL